MLDEGFYKERPVLLSSIPPSFGKHRIYSGRIQGDPFAEHLPVSNMVDSIVLWKEYLTSYTGMVYGFENVSGKSGMGLGLINQLIWTNAMRKSDAAGRLRVLQRSNAGYWINPNGKPQYDSNGKPIISPDRIRVIKGALPRAFLVPGMRVPGKGKMFYTYYHKDFDPTSAVLLYEPVDFQESSQFKGEVDELTYSPNHVTVKTRQEGNGFLVLLDSYFPGWTVTVDGEERPILQANHFYRAVQLGPGEHTLEFDYFPEGFKQGLVVSAIFLLILIALPFCKPMQRLKFQPSPASGEGSDPEIPLESDATGDK